MISQEQIQGMLTEVENDERLYYPAADVFSNAPLALIQVQLETKSSLLRSILEMPKLDLNKLRKK